MCLSSLGACVSALGACIAFGPDTPTAGLLDVVVFLPRPHDPHTTPCSGSGPPPVDPLPPQGPAPSGVSQVDAVEPVEVAGDSGAATGAEPAGAGSGGTEPEGAEPGGAESGGAASGGAEPGGAESEGTEPGGAESGGAELGGTEPGGAEPGGAGSARVASRGASSRRELLSPQELREWFARRWSRASAAAGPGGAAEATGVGGTTAAAGSGGTCPGGAGAAGPGGPTEAAGVGPPGGSAGASGGTGAAGSSGTGAGGAIGVGAGGSADAGMSEGAGVGAAGAGDVAGAGAPAGSPGAVPAGSGGATRPRPYFVPLLEQVLGLPPSPGPAPPLECPQPVQSQSQLPPVSPLPAPSPYTGPAGGLADRRAPASRPASPARPACTRRRTSRPRPPPVPGTHQMTLRPSTAPLRVPLPSPPASSLPVLADPESDSLRAASPTVARFLATVVTDPSLASNAASALVAELVDFAACCRLDYAASLVVESVSVCPPSVGGECALSTDVLEDRQEDFQCFAAALPHLVSTLLAPEGDPDAPDIPTPRSYAEAIEGTYVDGVPPPGANIVSGMWIFRVKRPPGSPPVFKARYVARGFSQRQGITRDRAQRTITLTQSHMVQQVLQRFDFTYSSPQATPLSTRHSLSALPSDESVEPSGPYPELVGCLMYLMTCTRPDLAYPLSILARYVAPGRHRPEHMAAAKRVLRYLCSTSGMGLVLGGRRPVVLTGHADASWADDQATQRSSQGYTFSLGSGSVSWRSTRLSSVLSSSCEAEIYAGAMAAQELRWLTYLLTDLGEQPRSPPVLYVDNKAMLALCRERRLEHRTKHIALRYFLARELKQRGAAGAGAGGSASTGGAGATGPRNARTGGTGAAGPGGAPGAGATGGAGAGGAAGVGATGGTGAGAAVSADCPAGAGAAGGTGAGGAAGVGADAGGAGLVPTGSGGAARPRPYFIPLLEQVLGLPPFSSPPPSLECPPPVQSESQLQLASPLPPPSPYAGPTGGLAERREPESRPASPVQSSLPALADPASDSLRTASPTVTRFLATSVTDPSFESAAASALVAELVDFAAHCRLDYVASLVAESASVCPPSVGGECALSTDVLEDKQEEFQCFAAALPHLVSLLLAPEGDPDAPDIPTPRFTQRRSRVPTPLSGRQPWTQRWLPGSPQAPTVKRPPGSPPVFKARYVAPGFNQWQGVDYFHTFSPTPKMTILRVLLHVAAQRDYELHSLDFSTAFLQGSLHEEIWLRRPPGFTGSFPPALGFAPSTADPSLFLRTDTSLPPFYILVYVDDLVFATADTAGLAHVKSELQKRHTCTDLGELRSYLGLHITRDRARRTITLT
ncbi:unnamed protein product [Closterium sp. NIES-53]